MKLINTEIVSVPSNWFRVWIMAAIAMIAWHYVVNAIVDRSAVAKEI